VSGEETIQVSVDLGEHVLEKVFKGDIYGALRESCPEIVSKMSRRKLLVEIFESRLAVLEIMDENKEEVEEIVRGDENKRKDLENLLTFLVTVISLKLEEH